MSQDEERGRTGGEPVGRKDQGETQAFYHTVDIMWNSDARLVVRRESETRQWRGI
jgi:hypothetical protein